MGPNRAEEGVARLAAAFPVGERLERLGPEVRAVQRAILCSYLQTGQPPAVAALDVEALADLVGCDAVVVRERRIVGAYPFSSDETGHTVRIGSVSVGSMCSLDALSVAPVFGLETTVESECAVTGASIVVHQPNVDPGSPVHIGVHFRDPESCAATSLCREMVFLRDAPTAAEWSAVDPDARGVYRLADAIEFAAGFFRAIVGVWPRP